jgi:hypothetical protein
VEQYIAMSTSRVKGINQATDARLVAAVHKQFINV